MLTGPTHGRKGRDAPIRMANTRDTVRARALCSPPFAFCLSPAMFFLHATAVMRQRAVSVKTQMKVSAACKECRDAQWPHSTND